MGRTSDAEQRLVDAARGLWYTRSYGDVGVSEICRAAGVQKGSFYHFFPSKQDLALAVIDAHQADFEADVVRPVTGMDASPLDRLNALAGRGLQAMERLRDTTGVVAGCPFGNLAVELSTLDEVVRERLERLFAWRTGFIQELLDQAVAAGELDAGLDTARAAQAIHAFYEGVLAASKTHGDTSPLRDLAPLAARLAGARVPDRAEVPAT